MSTEKRNEISINSELFSKLTSTLTTTQDITDEYLTSGSVTYHLREPFYFEGAGLNWTINNIQVCFDIWSNEPRLKMRCKTIEPEEPEDKAVTSFICHMPPKEYIREMYRIALEQEKLPGHGVFHNHTISDEFVDWTDWEYLNKTGQEPNGGEDK